MKPDIHPNFKESKIICACGAEFKQCLQLAK